MNSRLKTRKKTAGTSSLPSPENFTLDNLPNEIKLYPQNEEKMRVLYLPLNGRLAKQEGTETAFIKNDFNLCVMDYLHCKHSDKYFSRLVDLFRPQWIHMQLQFTNGISIETLKSVKTKHPDIIVTNWTGDIRAEARHEFIDTSKCIDHSFISSVGQLQMYKDAGCKNVDYWQIGVDPKKFHPLPKNIVEALKKKKYHHDVVFCAHRNEVFPGAKYRDKVVIELNREFGKNFAVYGNRAWKKLGVNYLGSLPHPKQNEAYNASKIVINVNNFNDIYKYFSGRQLIAMATGRLVVCSYVPGLEEYFKNYHHVVWFYNAKECVELVKHYLSHPLEANQIGTEGRNKVLSEHTLEERIKDLVKKLKIRR